MKRFIPIVFVLGACGAMAPVTACNASSAQLQQTEADAFKLAGCVLSTIFAGTTDPLAIGAQCAGALPAVIVDVIEDFQAKPKDAGVGASLDSHTQALLDEAKAKAKAAK
jgi:hypothetical protein